MVFITKMPGVTNLHLESRKIQLKLIVATCRDNGIGKENNLPWRLKSELAYFARLTKTTRDFSKQNAVLMGRKTWQSIPARVRPLRNRINIVLSSLPKSDISESEDVFVCKSFAEAVELVDSLNEKIESCWVIGGSSVYEEAMTNVRLEKLYITRILKDFDCDTFFPSVNTVKWKLTEDKDVPGEVQEEDGVQFKYEVFQRGGDLE